jgi:hypothetical protein
MSRRDVVDKRPLEKPVVCEAGRRQRLNVQGTVTYPIA